MNDISDLEMKLRTIKIYDKCKEFIQRTKKHKGKSVGFIQYFDDNMYSLMVFHHNNQAEAILSTSAEPTPENYILMKNTFEYFGKELDHDSFDDIFSNKKNFKEAFDFKCELDSAFSKVHVNFPSNLTKVVGQEFSKSAKSHFNYLLNDEYFQYLRSIDTGLNLAGAIFTFIYTAIYPLLVFSGTSRRIFDKIQQRNSYPKKYNHYLSFASAVSRDVLFDTFYDVLSLPGIHIHYNTGYYSENKRKEILSFYNNILTKEDNSSLLKKQKEQSI
jgi:hypothetical protein